MAGERKVFSPDDPFLAKVDRALRSGPASEQFRETEGRPVAAGGVGQQEELEARDQPEAGFVERAKMSLATKAGTIEAYLKKAGKEVMRSPYGDLLFRSPGGKWQYVDRPGLTAKDFADITGAAVETVPGAVASLWGAKGGSAGRSILRGSIADLAASGARMGLSNLFLGEGYTPEEAGIRAGINAAGGLAGAGSAYGGRAAARNLIPSARTKEAIRTGMLEGRPLAEVEKVVGKGQELEKEIGADLTAGQLAKSYVVRGMERSMATSQESGVARTIDMRREAQEQAMQKHWKDTLRNVSPDVEPGPAAREAYDAGNEALAKSMVARKEAGDAAFKKANDTVQGLAVIPVPSLRRFINETIARYDKPGIIGERRTIRDALAAERDKFVKASGDGEWMMSPQQLADALSGFGGVAFGKEPLGAALQKPSTARGKMREAWKALIDDLDAAASGSSMHPEAAAQLKAARTEYAEMSEYAADNSAKMLRDMFSLAENEAIETIPQKMARTMTLEQITKGLKVIDAGDQTAANALRRAALEEMVSGADKARGWSLDTMLSTLGDPKKQKRMAAILGVSPERRDFFNRLAFEIQYLRRATFSGTVPGGHKAISGSATAPRQEAAQAIAQGVAGSRLTNIARAINLSMSPQAQVTMMATQDGRKALLDLMRAQRTQGRNLGSVAVQFLTIFARDDASKSEEETAQ